MKIAVVVVVMIAIVSSFVFGILALLAFIGSPLDLKKIYGEQPSDISVSLHNQNKQPISLQNIELGPSASIELRSLSQTLFIRWQGHVKLFGQELAPSTQLKLENSIYGKYSISIDQTLWKSLIDAPIAESPCRRHIVTWFNPLPSEGLVLSVNDRENAAYFQTSNYIKGTSTDLFEVEMEEYYNRYSSKGSDFYYRYHCQTTGETDRLGQLVLLIEKLFH